MLVGEGFDIGAVAGERRATGGTAFDGRALSGDTDSWVTDTIRRTVCHESKISTKK